MQILIDTNVFIERERDAVIPESLQQLENLLKSNGHTILIHPLSKEEVRAYENDERREIAESKIATYAELTYPDYPRSSHREFRDRIPEVDSRNERVDNVLLFSVYDEQVDLLVTEDRGIHEKATRLTMEDRVYTIDGAFDVLSDDEPAYTGPVSIQRVRVGELDPEDPIFESLRDEYAEFDEWIRGIPDRDAYVCWNRDDTLGAVLILKPNEAESLGNEPELPSRDRLKICTLKVAAGRRGTKLGELLVSIAIREAIEEELEEIYLTHRIRDQDHLARLVSEYGFTHASEKANGESVFVKRLTPGPGDDPDPMETNIRFYPSFHDGPAVDKFIVPIQPEYHSRLFPTYGKRQPKLHEFDGRTNSEGNAIKKAYLSHAQTRQVAPGDVLLFYRSRDHKELTTVGVCDRIEYEVESADRARDLVESRSVFERHEIEDRLERPTTVLLFKWHFTLENPLHYHQLREEQVLSAGPQTIQQLDHEDYCYVREAGGIDERFTIN